MTAAHQEGSGTKSHYDVELDRLAATYEGALSAAIAPIKAAISGASGASIIGVGSGGSFTVASLLCDLHEAYTGRVSRASTPLEIICNPTLAAASPVFLISAEGKNPDILEAVERARLHSARPLHIITNREDSPLLNNARRFSDITTHIFSTTEKDGYLATNSLLLNAVLIARAYGELDGTAQRLETSVDQFRIGKESLADWVKGAATFVEEVGRRQGLIITYSPLLRAIAADLESKLAESALLFCQATDLRSFAHGRHLWLANRRQDVAILAIIEPSLSGLWTAMSALLPSDVPVLSMHLAGASPPELLAGLIAEMRLISAFASRLSTDPGKPDVPQFGRDLHYLDLTKLIPAPNVPTDRGLNAKFDVLGARWPSIERQGFVRRALDAYHAVIEQQTFRAVVFDYDGTLSISHPTDRPPPAEIIKHLLRLIAAGVHIGIASGRGGSIQDRLRESLPSEVWSRVYVGLYNAGCICSLDATPPAQGPTSEFLSHVTRIVGRLRQLGVPIEKIRTTHPYQVSVRFREGVQAQSNWFVVADAIRQAGLDPSRVFHSKHSVDILATNVDKSHLVAHMVQRERIDPYQVLTVGDQGAWPGNDSSLLEHRFSLSVDIPSRRLDRGWKIAPAHKRGVDATLFYLERISPVETGRFVIRVANEKEKH